MTTATIIPTIAPVDTPDFCVIFGSPLVRLAGRIAIISEGAFSTQAFWRTEKVEFS